MGGINHQPCSNFLPDSTEVSKALSQLQIAFWQSNLEFENAILANLHGHNATVAPSIQHIETALKCADDADNALGELITKLALLDFQELPETTRVLEIISDELREEAAITFSAEMTDNLNKILMTNGFRDLFKHYQARLRSIRANLDLVRIDFETLAQSSRLVQDCEENSTDIRINFTRTTMLLNNLVTEWSYSAIASATMWNLNQGHQTMIPLKLMSTWASPAF